MSAAPAWSEAQRTRLVAPPLSGPPTGGTLYDARLVEALRARGVRASAVSPGEAEVLAPDPSESLWVDSLFLDAMPRLAAASGGRAGLLLHYLPSLVALGARFTPADLTAVERDALFAAARIVAPSQWLADVVVRAGVPRARVLVVEPGVAPDPGGAPRAVEPVTRALVLANVVPGKGIAPLLRALAGAPTVLSLDVIGSLDADPPYVAECRAAAVGAGTVRFLGALLPEAAARALAGSDVLVSASRMESYGMALAEARALGVPILALRAGNAEAHVDPRAGGRLFDDDDGLAGALIALSLDQDERAARLAQARGARRRRTWADAARDFVARTRCP